MVLFSGIRLDSQSPLQRADRFVSLQAQLTRGPYAWAAYLINKVQ